MVKQVYNFDGKKADDFLERYSKLRVSLSLYNKSTFNIVQGSQRPSESDNDQAIAREACDDANHNVYIIFYFTTSSPTFSVVRRSEGKTRGEGVGHGQYAWIVLCEKFGGCAREIFACSTPRNGNDKDAFK